MNMLSIHLYLRQGLRLLSSLSLIASLCFLNIGSAAGAPLLIDLVVTGTVDAPNFDPQQLQFDMGQDYLLVMMNDKPYPVTFTFNKFGQSVATRLLQGAANVTQDSIVLFPSTKVIWHFIPQIAGEFDYFAVNSGYNQRGTVGKIVIKAPAKMQEAESPSPPLRPSEEKEKISGARSIREKSHVLTR